MTTGIPNITVINQQEKPEKYKDIYVKFLQAIIEANNSKSLDVRINAYINCMNIGLGAIPNDAYNIRRLQYAKPDYKKFEEQYFNSRPLLVKEIAYYHIHDIRKQWKELWLNNLQDEFQIINHLVKIHTNWFFDAPRTENIV
jgi:hypothetical protein